MVMSKEMLILGNINKNKDRIKLCQEPEGKMRQNRLKKYNASQILSAANNICKGEWKECDILK